MNFLDSVVRLCQRQYVALLLALLAITIGAGVLAWDLELDADLAGLLPETAPSVQGLNELERVYEGTIGRLTVVLDSPTSEEVQAAALALGADVETLEGVQRVEVRRALTFFRDHRLLYVEYEDLEEIDARVRRRLRWERGQANPLFAGLRPDDPPEIELDDIKARYDDIPTDDFYTNKDGRRVVFFIYPDFPASDLGRAQALIERVRERADAVLGPGFPGTEYALTGRYMKRVEQELVVGQDLRNATLIALGLLLAFMLLYLRSLLATAIVLIPLVTGTIWAFAWASVAFGSLNILTGFLGAILLGLGVDYGIHLVSRYFDIRADEATVTEALVVTLATAGRASLFAGITTIIALGSLAFSSFQAFHQFGVIALGGLALILLAYATVFPALIIAISGLHVRPRPPQPVLLSRRLAKFFTLDVSSSAREVRRFHKLYRVVMGTLALIAVLATLGIPSVKLDRDFRTLQVTDTPTWELDEEVNELIGQSQTPGVVLVESPDHRDRVVTELRRRVEVTPQGYTVDEVLSIDDVLPERVEDKQALLEELREELETVPLGERTEELEEFLAEVEQTLEALPLTLPEELRIPFSRRDLPDGSAVLVFPSVALDEGQVMRDFSAIMRDLPPAQPGGELTQGVSDALLLVDIVDYVERDTLVMVLVTTMGLFFIALVAFRLRRELFWLLGTLALSLYCAVGVVHLLGVPFNIVNLIVLPVWLGLTVDASFHMYQRIGDQPERVQPHLAVGGAIMAAFITSMIGFGSMLVARHAGLFSLGQIAFFGLGTILLVNLAVQLAHVMRLQQGASAEPELVTEPEPDPAPGKARKLGDDHAPQELPKGQPG